MHDLGRYTTAKPNTEGHKQKRENTLLKPEITLFGGFEYTLRLLIEKGEGRIYSYDRVVGPVKLYFEKLYVFELDPTKEMEMFSKPSYGLKVIKEMKLTVLQCTALIAWDIAPLYKLQSGE